MHFCSQDILGVAGVGVIGCHIQCRTALAAGHDLVNRDGRSCVSKIHVVVCLVAELRIKFLLVGQLILTVDIVDHDALLVDGEPVLDLVLVLVEDEAGIILKVIHDLAAAQPPYLFTSAIGRS